LFTCVGFSSCCYRWLQVADIEPDNLGVTSHHHHHRHQQQEQEQQEHYADETSEKMTHSLPGMTLSHHTLIML